MIGTRRELWLGCPQTMKMILCEDAQEMNSNKQIGFYLRTYRKLTKIIFYGDHVYLQMNKPNFRTFRALYVGKLILKIWAFKTLPSWPSQTTIRAQEICYNWHWKRNKNGNYLSNGLYFMLINLNGLATMYIWPSHLLK